MTTMERPHLGTAINGRAAARARLEAELALAARFAVAAQPLKQFVAINPLSGLEDQPFDRAIADAAARMGLRGTLPEASFRQLLASGRITEGQLRAAVRAEVGEDADRTLGADRAPITALDVIVDDLLRGPLPGSPPAAGRTLAQELAPGLAAQIDRRTARWCAAFTDAGQAGWSMPAREHGLYGAWRALGADEPGCPRRLRTALRQAPADAIDAILAALAQLAVPEGAWRSYLEQHLVAMPGWAGHLRWLERHGGAATPADLLAIRLVQEAALLPPAAWQQAVPRRPLQLRNPSDVAARAADLLRRRPGPSAQSVVEALDLLPASRRGMVWLAALESGYRDELLSTIGSAPPDRSTSAAGAQVVCCIDPRSEGLRRHLERVGAYETHGFAGFFGLALNHHELGSEHGDAHCPVIVAPQLVTREAPIGGQEPAARRRLAREATGRHARSGGHAAKLDTLGPFALAEAGGVAAGALAAVRTFAAQRLVAGRARASELTRPHVVTTVELPADFTLEARAAFAEQVLRTIGLVDRFAPVVVLCAHASHSDNNPYASALACGACGGRGGAPNARAAAGVFNDPSVRDLVRERGIEIPPSTWFVAAEHDTITDLVTVLDLHLVPPGFRSSVQRVAADLQRAGAALAAERWSGLPGSSRRGPAALHERGSDWAQVFPEWGLAGNAAMIIGPRSLTRHADLGCRAFLHSYDASIDTDGSALEAILTAPLVVAHGINAQYYFSTVEPELLGAGTKTVHNVVGGIGALSGPGGDLRIGLPWQSIAERDALRHEPMRLLVVVEAPLERVAEIAGRHPGLLRLLDGGWVTLLARAPGEQAWQSWAGSRSDRRGAAGSVDR